MARSSSLQKSHSSGYEGASSQSGGSLCNSCCAWIAIILGFLLLIVLLLAGIYYAFLQSNLPIVRLHRIDVYKLNLTTNSNQDTLLTAEIEVRLNITNQSEKLDLIYSTMTAKMDTEGIEFPAVKIARMLQKPEAGKDVRLRMSFEDKVVEEAAARQLMDNSNAHMMLINVVARGRIDFFYDGHKDSFSEKMDHEKSLMAEISQREKIQMILDFEKKKQELEDEMQRKKEEIENHLLAKEKTFEQERENELNNINYLREIGRREMEEMKLERLGLETEKLEILQNKNYVEAQQSEIKRDIEELVGLSQKLKDQRDVFIEERSRFIAFTEKQANCNICGEAIREFILSDLKPSPELKKFEAPPLPSFAENYLKEAVEGRSAVESSPILDNSGSPSSGGTISWLRKCTSKIFKFSAGKKLELDYAQDSKQVAEPQPSTQVDLAEASLGSGDMEPQQTAQVVNDSVDVFKEVGAVQTLPVEQDPLNIPENTSSSSDKGVMTRETRKRSMKATVSGSKVNSEAANTKEESQAESDIVGTPRNKRKRDADQGSRVTASDNQTEGHSDIIKDGNRRKRRQKIIATEQSFGQKRYNLRHAKKSVGTDTDGSALQVGDRNDTEQLPSSEANQFDIGIGGDPNEAIHKTRSTDGDGNNDHPLQSTEVTSEFSDSRLKNAEGAISSRHGDIAYSEEMNRTAEGETDYNSQGFTTESLRKDGTEDDNDEVDHPGQVSIGKKLWTFITT